MAWFIREEAQLNSLTVGIIAATQLQDPGFNLVLFLKSFSVIIGAERWIGWIGRDKSPLSGNKCECVFRALQLFL